MAGPGPIALSRHPDSRNCPLVRIEAVIQRTQPDRLDLKYEAWGNLGKVRWPTSEGAGPVRQDGLWQHTCIEAFTRHADGYDEYNLSPSRDWAVYRFDGYRSGMQALEVEPPIIRSSLTRTGDAAGWFQLSALIEIAPEADALALAAVIEDTNGDKSYWAIKHGAGKPDFHHAAGFAIDLRKI